MSSVPHVRPGEPSARRQALLVTAVRLSRLSVIWGMASGGWSITSGILAGSLGVIGLGLTSFADVGGSIGLLWRFRIERRAPDRADQAEARVSLLVAASLTIAGVALAVEAIRALAAGSGPGQSISAMASAAAAAAVLTPIGLGKRRVGAALASHALRGDGTLSCISAALGVLALLGLLSNRVLGWWWADRAAALVVAVIAMVEASNVIRHRPRGA